MATTTPNHGFNKPASTDTVNIADLNYNMDKLDDLFDGQFITLLEYAISAINKPISKSDTVAEALGKLEKRLVTVEGATGNPTALSASNIAADYNANLSAPVDIKGTDTILQVLQKLMAYIRFWTVRRIAVVDGRAGKSLTAYNFDNVATATVTIPTKLSDLSVSEPLTIANGGTGATTAQNASGTLGTCYATCTAAARIVAKTADIGVKNGAFNRFPGAVAYVQFTNGNTATSPTIDINGTGAGSITNCYTNAAISSTDITAGMTAMLVWDGQAWVLMNPATANGQTSKV